MTEQPTTLSQRLSHVLGDKAAAIVEAHGEVTLEVSPGNYLDAARALRDHEELAFTQLTDLCGVDYLGFGDDEWSTREVTAQGFSRGVSGDAGPGRFDWEERPEVEMERRFAVVLHLLSIQHNERLRLRVFAEDSAFPVVASVVDLWASANWYERETFDLYGIVFEGHPDLRRLLTDYGFVGHPFRKDFPLVGNVEVRYDAEKGRVIYQPVTIEPRVLVPKVIRTDGRYAGEDRVTGDADGHE